MNFHVDEENIVLRKPEKSCFVTGEVSESNIELLGGRMVLSKEGALELIILKRV